MASRHFYIQLIIRVLLITLTAVAFPFALAEKWHLMLVLTLVLLVSQVYSLIVFINRTNRKIAYFFDAIRSNIIRKF